MSVLMILFVLYVGRIIKTMKIKRKPLPKVEVREITPEERIRAIIGRVTTRIGELKLCYDKYGYDRTVEFAANKLSNGGFTNGGFWVAGIPDGIRVLIYEGANYSKDRKLVARGMISWEEVVDYLVKGNESCDSKSPKVKRKLRKKKKSA